MNDKQYNDQYQQIDPNQSNQFLQNSIFYEEKKVNRAEEYSDPFNSSEQTFFFDENRDENIFFQRGKNESYSTVNLQRIEDAFQSSNKYYEEPDNFFQQQQISNQEISSNEEQLLEQTKEIVEIAPTSKNKQMDVQIYRKRDYSRLFVPRMLNSQKKFYIFTEQLIDLDYYNSIAQGNEEEFFKQDMEVSLYTGMKFVNRVEHRIDNKCIEIYLDYGNIYTQDISQLISFIDSLGNKYLHEMAQVISLFWDQYATSFKNAIREQRESALFQIHKEMRYKAALEEFKDLTKNIDQNKYLVYFLYRPNYQDLQFDSYIIGYNPKMYELIGENSYNFIINLQRTGYFDPFSKKYRLEESMNRVKEYITNQMNKKINQSDQSFRPSEIKTMDNFIFPTLTSSVKINLNNQYDKMNNLSFKANEVLIFYEFKLQDETILENLSLARQQQSQNLGKMNQQEINEFNYGIDQDEFFNKYYGEDIGELLKKGNKWMKRCGFVDIPKKKQNK